MNTAQRYYLAGVLESQDKWTGLGLKAQLTFPHSRHSQYMSKTYGGEWIGPMWVLDLGSKIRLLNEVEPYFRILSPPECDVIRDRLYNEIKRREKSGRVNPLFPGFHD